MGTTASVYVHHKLCVKAGDLVSAVLNMRQFAYKFFPDALDVWPGIWDYLHDYEIGRAQYAKLTPDFAENWLLEIEEVETIAILRHSWYPQYWINVFINNYFVKCHEYAWERFLNYQRWQDEVCMERLRPKFTSMSYEEFANLWDRMSDPPEEAIAFIQKALDRARLLCETSINHQLPIVVEW